MLNNVSAPLNHPTATSFSKSLNSKVSLLANEAVAVLPQNSKRMYAVFINNSTVDITLVFDDKLKAVIDKGIVIKGYGGSYEITSSNLYTGKISAISESVTQLSFVEGFE